MRAAVNSIQALLFLTLTAMQPVISTVSAGEAEPEKREESIGYPSVAEARQALGKKEGVDVRIESGWTIATDKPENSSWIAFLPLIAPPVIALAMSIALWVARAKGNQRWQKRYALVLVFLPIVTVGPLLLFE